MSKKISGGSSILKSGGKKFQRTIDRDDPEYIEALMAAVSILSCNVAAESIRTGYMHVCDITDKPVIITKMELMQNRKRDFKVHRTLPATGVVRRKSDTPQISNYNPDIYTNYFYRDYHHSSYKETLQRLNPQHPEYHAIRHIDFCGLQLGDDLMTEFFLHLKHCPVEVLSLSNNNISDTSLVRFAHVWRDLRHLRALHLADNKFTDLGVEAMFHVDRYCPNLRVLNICRNNIDYRSGYVLGTLFTPNRICQLEELYIGGQVHRNFCGDRLLQMLVAHLVLPGARALRKLTVADFGLKDDGILALITLLLSNEVLEELNIGRNGIAKSSYYHPLKLSLRVNKSVHTLHCEQCGLRRAELRDLKFQCTQSKIDWHESCLLSDIFTQQMFRLGVQRSEEEKIYRIIRNAKPPVKRQKMPTKSQEGNIRRDICVVLRISAVFGNGIMNGTKPWPDMIKQTDDTPEEPIHHNVYVHYMKKMHIPLRVLQAAALGTPHRIIRKMYPQAAAVVSVPETDNTAEESPQRQIANIFVKKVVTAATNKSLSLQQLSFISPSTAYVIDNRINIRYSDFLKSDRFAALNTNLQQYLVRFIKQHQCINTMLHHLLYLQRGTGQSDHGIMLQSILGTSRDVLLFAVKILDRIADHPERFINQPGTATLQFDGLYISLEDACSAQERIHRVLEQYIAQLVRDELVHQEREASSDAMVALRDDREGVAHPIATAYLGNALSWSCLKDVVLRLEEIDYDAVIEEQELRLANAKRKPIRTEARSFKPRVGTRFSIRKKPEAEKVT